MKRKTVAGLIALALLATTLTGCGKDTPTPEKEYSYEELIQIGTEAYDKGNYADAIDSLETAIEKEPTAIEAYGILANAYERTGHEANAAKTYVKATEVVQKLYPKNSELPLEAVTLYKDAVAFAAGCDNMAAATQYAAEAVTLAGGEAKETLKKDISDIMDKHGRYKSYYDYLVSLQEIYGLTEMHRVSEEEYRTYLTGLSYARLIDFDNDGDEELLVAYSTSKPSAAETIPSYEIEVWNYEFWSGNAVVKEEERMKQIYSSPGFTYDGGSVEIYLSKREGITHLIEGSGEGYEYSIIRTFDNDGVKLVNTIQFQWDQTAEPLVSPSIDGAPATQEECIELSNYWWNDIDVYDLSSGPYDEIRSIESLCQTLESLEAVVQEHRAVLPQADEIADQQILDGAPAPDHPEDVWNYYDIYKPLLMENEAMYSDFHNIYFLDDINGDEVLELLLREGTCEADFEYKIYTVDIKNACPKFLGAIGGSHTVFYADETGGCEPYILQVCGLMGYQVLNKISIDTDAILVQSISEGPVETYYSNPYPLTYAEVNDYFLLY